MEAVPIGIVDTAIGGQRIEEFMPNGTDAGIHLCSQRTGENLPQWDGPLYGKQVLPYIDMTVKGFLWCTLAVPTLRFSRLLCSRRPHPHSIASS